jgi:hypothetical protein
VLEIITECNIDLNISVEWNIKVTPNYFQSIYKV